MNKAVLISIRPEWCALIVDGQKTIEVRKSKPNLATPFKCYIYCTKKDNMGLLGEGPLLVLNNRVCNTKVIGEFVCDKITFLGNISTDKWDLLLGSTHESYKRLVTEGACLTEGELHAYGGKEAWHISDLVLYDSPKDPEDFNVEASNKIWSFTKKLERPPQSWCYVQKLTEGGEDHA